MSKPDKQKSVHAASFMRVSKDHLAYARSSAFIARSKEISDEARAAHRAAAFMHRQSADINKAEAKRLRAMR